RCLEPQHIGVWRIRESAGDGSLNPALNAEVPFRSALAGDEFLVYRIDIGREQSGAVGIGTRDEYSWNIANIGSQPGAGERTNEMRGRHQNLSAQVTALFL